MALTLPYPGMVFVPLDILTAEQQNRIVANYTYISNQFPIASSNIDFTTINKYPEKCADVVSPAGQYITFDIDTSTTDYLFYDVDIFVYSPSSTGNGGIALDTGNTKQGQAWTRRIGYENGGFSDEYSIPQSDPGVCYFTRGTTGGTSSISCFIHGSICVEAGQSSNSICGVFLMHVTGISSSMVSTFEAILVPSNGKITLKLRRSNGQVMGYARVYKRKQS